MKHGRIACRSCGDTVAECRCCSEGKPVIGLTTCPKCASNN